MLFNFAKNFLDRLINLRDIESQTSKENRIIRIFEDELYDVFSTYRYCTLLRCVVLLPTKHCVEFCVGFSTKKMTVQSWHKLRNLTNLHVSHF
jgi:hypothetical protein